MNIKRSVARWAVILLAASSASLAPMVHGATTASACIGTSIQAPPTTVNGVLNAVQQNPAASYPTVVCQTGGGPVCDDYTGGSRGPNGATAEYTVCPNGYDATPGGSTGQAPPATLVSLPVELTFDAAGNETLQTLPKTVSTLDSTGAVVSSTVNGLTQATLGTSAAPANTSGTDISANNQTCVANSQPGKVLAKKPAAIRDAGTNSLSYSLQYQFFPYEFPDARVVNGVKTVQYLFCGVGGSASQVSTWQSQTGGAMTYEDTSTTYKIGGNYLDAATPSNINIGLGFSLPAGTPGAGVNGTVSVTPQDYNRGAQGAPTPQNLWIDKQGWNFNQVNGYWDGSCTFCNKQGTQNYEGAVVEGLYEFNMPPQGSRSAPLTFALQEWIIVWNY